MVLSTFAGSGPAIAAPFVPAALRHLRFEPASQEVASAVVPSLLRVTTGIDLHPASAVRSQVLVDGTPRDEWGLNWVKIDPGIHLISFTDVPNLGTPAPITVTTVAGEVTQVQGVFSARGFLRVVTDPPVPATISVDGVPRDDWGLWMALPPATYTVSFGAVSGYTAPPDETVQVVAEQTATVTGLYTVNPNSKGPDPSTFGELRVTTQTDDGTPGVWTQVLVDGIPRDEWGTNWVKMPLGIHSVAFTDVPGLGTPPPQTVDVVANQTTTAVGVFARCGSLRVRTDPAVAATISVDGVPRDDWGMWMSVPPGTYNVTFEPLSGLAVPASQLLSVPPGALTVATGEYAPAEASSNWAGYTIATDFTTPQPLISDVNGSWIVPTIQPTSKTQYSSVWIGVGGFFSGDTSLIQTGTEADSGSGTTFYAAWYELLPDVSIRITNQMTVCPVLPTTNFCLVKPGDTILSEVALKDPTSNLWTISLLDPSQSWKFLMDVTYVSSERSAEWIVERPALCGAGGCRLTTLATFTSVPLGQSLTNGTGTNFGTIDGFHGPIGAFPRRVVLMYSGQTLIAQASELTPDATSFLVAKVG